VDGVSYPDGAELPRQDCNDCFCEAGHAVCYAAYCPAECEVDGRRYPSGEEVPSADCNECTCEDGQVVCTDRACGGGAACVVNGMEYPSGTAGIKDPFSCNLCVCEDGQLGCDTADCPETCPPNAVPGTSCARCGPVDNCEAVETGCLIVCDQGDASACDNEHPFCGENACRNVCG
jgi:hypothetical protein